MEHEVRGNLPEWVGFKLTTKEIAASQTPRDDFFFLLITRHCQWEKGVILNG